MACGSSSSFVHGIQVHERLAAWSSVHTSKPTRTYTITFCGPRPTHHLSTNLPSPSIGTQTAETPTHGRLAQHAVPAPTKAHVIGISIAIVSPYLSLYRYWSISREPHRERGRRTRKLDSPFTAAVGGLQKGAAGRKEERKQREREREGKDRRLAMRCNVSSTIRVTPELEGRWESTEVLERPFRPNPVSVFQDGVGSSSASTSQASERASERERGEKERKRGGGSV